jgi:hypothetical protein
MDAQKMDALATTVGQVDAESPEAQAARAAEEATQQAAEVKAVSMAEAWATVPSMIGKLACIVEPALGQFYTPQACQEWGEAMVPVAEKYGWGGPGAMPEVNLAIVTAGMAVPTFMMLRVKLAQLKAAAAPPAAAAALAVAPGAASPADVSALAAVAEGAPGGG